MQPPAGRSISLELHREGYHARAALAWVPTRDFPAVAEHAAGILHAEELAVFDGFRVKRRRMSYLLGRHAAKAALARCLGPAFAPAATRIENGIFSQPVLRAPFPCPFEVGISHNDHLACGLAFPVEHPMALDVEAVDARRSSVMASQALPAESELAQTVCGDKDLAATVLWTAKEALSKALRCGMTCPYELLEVHELMADADGFVGRFRNFAQYKFQSWRRGDTVLTIVLPKKTTMTPAPPELP